MDPGWGDSPTRSTAGDEHRGIRFLSISGTDIAVDPAAQFYTRYLVKVQLPSGKTDILPRRYREFRALHDAVRLLPASDRPQRSELPMITSKKWGGSNTQELVEKRTRKLQEYLVSLSSIALLFPAVERVLDGFFTLAADDATGGGADDDEDSGLGGALDDVSQSPAPRSAAPRPSRSSLPGVGSVAVARASLAEQGLSAAAPRTSLAGQGTSAAPPLPPPQRASFAAASPSPSPSTSPLNVGGRAPAASGLDMATGTPPTASPSREGGRCDACEREIAGAAAIVPAAAPATPTWDVGRFCSPQCERFFTAAMHKGFILTTIAGKRQIANVTAGASSAEGEGAHESAAAPPMTAPSGLPPSKIGALRSGASTWWGSARKVLGGATPAGPPSTTPKGSGGGGGGFGFEPESRRGSAADDGGTAVEGGRKEASGSRGSSNYGGAGASSGDEGDPGGIATCGTGIDDDAERQKFFLDRRKDRNSTRILTKWGTVRSLMIASTAISGIGASPAPATAPAPARGSRELEASAPVPPPPPPPSVTKTTPPPPPLRRSASVDSSGVAGAAVSTAEVLHQKGFLWKRGGYKGEARKARGRPANWCDPRPMPLQGVAKRGSGATLSSGTARSTTTRRHAACC